MLSVMVAGRGSVVELAELMMILELHRQGLSVSAISRTCGIDRKTIRKYIDRGLEAPAYSARAPRSTVIDPFEVTPDFPYGHTYGLRQLHGETVPMTEEETAAMVALQQEVDEIEAASAEAEELTDEQDERMGEIETAMEALNDRPVVFDPDELAQAGVFVSITIGGALRIERRYVRPEDEQPIEPAEGRAEADVQASADGGADEETRVDHQGSAQDVAVEQEEDGLKPCPTVS
jgi:ParB family chromosome partitioning protein